MSDIADEPAEQTPELSVVIPAFNAAETIEVQLRALLAQDWTGSWEIVVADNGSSDDTRDVVERLASADRRVRLIDAGERSGAAHARNRAVAESRGRSIAFCDADDMVGDGWLNAIGNALRRTDFVTGPQEYERLNPPWLHGVHGTVPARALQTFAGIFPFGPTANLGVRRDVLQAAHGFDPSIVPHEDIELCLRMWLCGTQLEFIPEAVVHYRYRATLRALWKQAVDYGAAGPDIARRLSEAGRPSPSPWRGARTWVWLLRRLPSLRTRAGRARWVVVAGGSTGRLLGSIRSRHLML